MKKFLDRQISVRTLLIMTMVVILATTVTAATITTIQATLATHITIKYDGEVQTMKDGNGDTVYPLLYQGTTYLPLRAITGMLGLPVEWDGATSTVLLGNTDSVWKSMFDVATFTNTTSVYGGWTKYTNTDDFPYKVDDFGNKLANDFTYAYRGTGISNASTTAAVTFENPQNYMSFTLARSDTLDKSVTFTITDADTNTIIYEANIIRGQFVEVELNIVGIKNLRIKAVSGGSTWATLFMLNPTVK